MSSTGYDLITEEMFQEALARIEALEAALRNIEYIDTSISYDGKDREYGECAKMARAALDKDTRK
jgi:hypothetical protein